ncbi:hypothetical protein E0L21_04285 [Kosakonia quasisacchari]|uniref:Uncharacterized protein n=1 Tax=Kosakonia quasisacchari TaxID=2529380 RepID=A0A4R0HTF7_9ENTR|nr:hypothetical protein E0L21_04285 [Kosakonia quasisacchari]
MVDSPLPVKRHLPVLRCDKGPQKSKRLTPRIQRLVKKRQTIIQRLYGAFQLNFAAFCEISREAAKKCPADAQTLSSVRNFATFADRF